jgi:uncharacterized SAM-binding protein YcdF (DUF218 family)
MYHFLSLVTQPFFILFLLLGLVIARFWWKRELTRGRLVWLTVLFLLLLALSTPAAGFLALGTLEWPYPPRAEIPDDVQAIVVLAGYVRPKDDVRPQPELASDTLYRCLHALTLRRRLPELPILVSGGLPESVPKGPPYAETMRDFLVEWGVPSSKVWLEDESRTTYENAIESCRILRERGIERIVLVTDAEHMLRAERCFHKQGIDVAPSACNHTATQFHGQLRDFLPSGDGAFRVERAAHEWLGTFYYWLRGRL